MPLLTLPVPLTDSQPSSALQLENGGLAILSSSFAVPSLQPIPEGFSAANINGTDDLHGNDMTAHAHSEADLFEPEQDVIPDDAEVDEIYAMLNPSSFFNGQSEETSGIHGKRSSRLVRKRQITDDGSEQYNHDLQQRTQSGSYDVRSEVLMLISKRNCLIMLTLPKVITNGVELNTSTTPNAFSSPPLCWIWTTLL